MTMKSNAKPCLGAPSAVQLTDKEEDNRAEDHLRQAVLNSLACRESRQTTQLCDCLCCRVTQELLNLGYDISRLLRSRR